MLTSGHATKLAAPSQFRTWHCLTITVLVFIADIAYPRQFSNIQFLMHAHAAFSIERQFAAQSINVVFSAVKKDAVRTLTARRIFPVIVQDWNVRLESRSTWQPKSVRLRI
jgi:hypothetical protein